MRSILTVVLLVSLVVVNAQNPTTYKENKKSISGQVVDPSGEALPYVSVVLMMPVDSVMVTGTATDIEGNFSMDVSADKYLLKFSFLSFENKFMAVDASNNVLLGKIQLIPSAESLNEVVVETQQNLMEIKLDKRVFNIDADLTNRGANAADILDNLPSISVDADGNVSLRGSENVRILIDGKPSSLVGMNGADALKQLQGDMIERVEVITNPSARYDAEGEVGILNIVLKKEKQNGVNGSINLRTGWPHNHGLSFNLNVRRQKANYFLNYGGGYNQGPGYGNTEIHFLYPDTNYSYKSREDHSRGGLNHNISAGTDFNITKLSSLTLSGNYGLSDGNNFSKLKYEDYNSSGEMVQIVDRREDETDARETQEVNANFIKNFSKKERKLTFDGKWSFSRDNENSLLREYANVSTYPNINQKTWSYENETRWLFQSDYIHPFLKDGKFETGVKAQLRDYRNNYGLADSIDGMLVMNPDYSNDMAYVEDIYAAYIMAGNKSGKFSYQGGLRSEYSHVVTELLKTNVVNERNYLNFFPSLHLSYELKKESDLQLSYSRRISRPRHWYLMPFFGFNDSRNFFSGNPNLNPEYTDAYELGYLKRWTRGTLLSSVYYRRTTGNIQRVITSDSVGFTQTYPVNLGLENNIGVEFSGSYDLKKWWSLNANVNLFQSYFDGSYEGASYDYESFIWSGRLSSRWRFQRKFSAQASYDYRSPQNTGQGNAKMIHHINIAASWDILKGNGTLSFNVRDLLNSRVRRIYSETDTFTSYNEFQWRARQFTLNFNYRINQKKQRDPRGDYEHDGGDMGM